MTREAWTIQRRGARYRDDEVAELSYRLLVAEGSFSADIPPKWTLDEVLDAIKPDDAAAYLAGLREHAALLRRLVSKCQDVAVTVTDGAPCAHCGRPVMPSESGRRLYCSRSCRQRAYEARKEAEDRDLRTDT